MFKVGDKVRCINNDSWPDCLTIGKIYTVLHVDSNTGLVTVVDDDYDDSQYYYFCFVLVKEKTMFKVGDKVRCVNNGFRPNVLTVGKVYTVLHVNMEDGLIGIVDDENLYYQYDHSRFELVKQPQDDLDQQKSKVLRELDYKKVIRVMHALDWKWVSVGIPTQEDHVKQVSRLIDNTIQAYRKSGESTYTGTGGWLVRIVKYHDGPLLSVAFEITDADGIN